MQGGVAFESEARNGTRSKGIRGGPEAEEGEAVV